MPLFQKISKKDLRNQVAETLTSTFDGLRETISPKKFQRNVKKASKVLLAGVKISPKKKLAKKAKSSAK